MSWGCVEYTPLIYCRPTIGYRTPKHPKLSIVHPRQFCPRVGLVRSRSASPPTSLYPWTFQSVQAGHTIHAIYTHPNEKLYHILVKAVACKDLPSTETPHSKENALYLDTLNRSFYPAIPSFRTDSSNPHAERYKFPWSQATNYRKTVNSHCSLHGAQAN